MYLLVEFTGNFQLEKMSDDDWSELHQAVPSVPAEKPKHCWIHGDHLVTDDNISVIQKFGLTFKISDRQADGGVGTMLVKLTDRIRSLELDAANTAQLIQNGAAVQIHVPDLVLLGFNEVTHADNCCTDALQSFLEEGWRIIAVCPPNAQRRPDYILGRRKHG